MLQVSGGKCAMWEFWNNENTVIVKASIAMEVYSWGWAGFSKNENNTQERVYSCKSVLDGQSTPR